MDAILDTLLTRLAYASLQALLLAAIVHAACRLLPGLSAAARTTLWWLLGAQLVTGLLCPAPFALPLLPAAAPVATIELTTGDAGDIAMSAARAAAPEWSLSWTAALLVAWALVVLVQAGFAAVRAYRLAGLARRAIAHDDVRVETLCARRARELGLRRSPRLAVSAEVDSPQVIGLWRPTILLPIEDTLDDEELDMALMHELAHVRRGDLILGWVPALARTLFFFHPLVHLATREYALCREAACDALVLSRGRQAPRTYGRLLLRLGVTPHPHHALPGASPTFRTLKRRLDMLGHATDAQPRVLTWCLVAVIAAVGVVPWRVVAADGTASTQAASPAASPTASAAPAAAAHPAAPAAPVPPSPISNTTITDGDESNDAFVFFNGGDTRVINGSTDDLRHAAAQRGDATDFVWYRDGARTWVLKDPTYLKRIRAAFARGMEPVGGPVIDADKQNEVDRRQLVLNEQMHKLAARQAELAVKESDPSGPHDAAAFAAGHAALAREQAAVAQKMADVDQIRAEQGRERAELGRRQAEASRQAAREVDAILAEAIRNRVAEAAR